MAIMMNWTSRGKARRERKAQVGSVMLEVSLGLTLLALVGGAALWAYQANSRRNEIKENATLISETIGSAQRVFGRTNKYSEVSSAKLVKSGVVPTQLRDAGSDTAHNSYGGEIRANSVAAGACNGSASGCMQLTWGSVPADQCVDLATQASLTVRSLTVGSTLVKPFDGALDDTTLTSICDTDGPKDLVMVFGRTS